MVVDNLGFLKIFNGNMDVIDDELDWKKLHDFHNDRKNYFLMGRIFL